MLAACRDIIEIDRNRASGIYVACLCIAAHTQNERRRLIGGFAVHVECQALIRVLRIRIGDDDRQLIGVDDLDGGRFQLLGSGEIKTVSAVPADDLILVIASVIFLTISPVSIEAAIVSGGERITQIAEQTRLVRIGGVKHIQNPRAALLIADHIAAATASGLIHRSDRKHQVQNAVEIIGIGTGA